MSATVTDQGITGDKTGVPTTGTSGLFTPASGSTVVVCVHYENSSNSSTILSANWNGAAMTQLVSQAASSATRQMEVWSVDNVTSAAGIVSVVFDFAPLMFSIAVVEVTGLAASPLDGSAQASTTSTSPTSGATGVLAQADEVQLGFIGTQGPTSDTAGTWGGSMTALQRGGTSGGTASVNTTLATAYRILAATTAVAAGKTGITSRNWVAICLTLKISTTPAPQTATLATATAAGAAPALTASVAAVSLALSTASAVGAAAALSAAVSALAHALGTATAAGDAPQIVDTVGALAHELATASAAGDAPEPSAIDLLNYPDSLLSEPAYTVEPIHASNLASVGIRSHGRPYFALVSQAAPALAVLAAGSAVHLTYSMALRQAPVQRVSADECHWLFSLHRTDVPGEMYAIGVTPNLALCVGFAGAILRSLPNVVPVNGQPHVYDFNRDSSYMAIAMDGVIVVQSENLARGVDVLAGSTSAAYRLLLFNGNDGASRVECDIRGAFIATEEAAFLWPFNEGVGSVIAGQQVGSAFGVVPVADPDPLASVGLAAGALNLAPTWYDPGTAPWGPPANTNLNSAWNWLSNTRFRSVAVARPTYRRTTGGATDFTPIDPAEELS